MPFFHRFQQELYINTTMVLEPTENELIYINGTQLSDMELETIYDNDNCLR